MSDQHRQHRKIDLQLPRKVLDSRADAIAIQLGHVAVTYNKQFTGPELECLRNVIAVLDEIAEGRR